MDAAAERAGNGMQMRVDTAAVRARAAEAFTFS
jgi:hypothetical protein